MAILDPFEDIRAARAAGLPLGDPAKLQKIIPAAVMAIEVTAGEVDASIVDVFMAISNVARIMIKKIENPAWDKGTRAAYRVTFLETLKKGLLRDLERDYP
jgi:hypothetical protein